MCKDVRRSEACSGSQLLDLRMSQSARRRHASGVEAHFVTHTQKLTYNSGNINWIQLYR